jgi:hypothetical protein
MSVGAAMLAGAMTPAPAMAREWGDDIEEILVSVAVLAGVVAVASEIFKDTARDWDDRDGRRDRDDDRSAAIDDCTRTAEREAERYGRDARVREVTDVDRDGSDYKVKGVVEVARGFGRDDRRDRERAKFSCTARYGRVTAFRFTDNFDYAYNN